MIDKPNAIEVEIKVKALFTVIEDENERAEHGDSDTRFVERMCKCVGPSVCPNLTCELFNVKVLKIRSTTA